jgi:hypothetical protein
MIFCERVAYFILFGLQYPAHFIVDCEYFRGFEHRFGTDIDAYPGTFLKIECKSILHGFLDGAHGI